MVKRLKKPVKREPGRVRVPLAASASAMNLANGLPPTRNPAPNTRYDWVTIMAEFVEGIPVAGTDSTRRPTLKELATRHGASYQTVRERASKERWTERREAFAVQAAAERQKKRAKKLAENAVEFDERAYNAANLGVTLVQVRLAEIMQEYQARKVYRDAAVQGLKDGDSSIKKEDLYSAIYHRELEGLANALSRFQEIGMKVFGTDVHKMELSGPEGTAIPVNVSAELTRDDPERAAAVIAALVDAGEIGFDVIENIIDAEVVEEGGGADQEATTEEATEEVAEQESAEDQAPTTSEEEPQAPVVEELEVLS